MTRTEIIIVAIIVIAIIAALAIRGSGPRVTQIDRTVRRERDEDSNA